MPKLYDEIRYMLTHDRTMRYDDKKLMWKLLELGGSVVNGVLTKESFMNALDFETIRRTRQKVQEDHKELGRNGVTKKETTGGKFVYHTKIPLFDNVNNLVRFN